MYPEGFLARVAQRKGEGDQGGILARDLYRGYVVERSGGLWLGALQKRRDADDDEYSSHGQQQDFGRRQVALGGSELVGNVDRGTALRGRRRGVCGRVRVRGKDRSRTGLIRHGFFRVPILLLKGKLNSIHVSLPWRTFVRVRCSGHRLWSARRDALAGYRSEFCPGARCGGNQC